jgi:hypothetical protein
VAALAVAKRAKNPSPVRAARISFEGFKRCSMLLAIADTLVTVNAASLQSAIFEQNYMNQLERV